MEMPPKQLTCLLISESETGLPLKRISIALPPEAKNATPKVFQISLETNKQLEKLCDGEAVVNKIEEIVDGAVVYHFVGPLYSAMMDENMYRRVLNKVFEYETALAVQKHIGLNAHTISSNVKLMDGEVCKAELGAVNFKEEEAPLCGSSRRGLGRPCLYPLRETVAVMGLLF
jgi:hypothetical protein